jgi:hypothetical protein
VVLAKKIFHGRDQGSGNGQNGIVNHGLASNPRRGGQAVAREQQERQLESAGPMAYH